MEIMSPQIKNEPEDEVMHNPSNVPTAPEYHQHNWPATAHSHGNAVSNGRSGRNGFGSSSNLSGGYHGGSSVLDDDVLADFVDFDPVQRETSDQQRIGPTHSYLLHPRGDHNDLGSSAPLQIGRDHLDSFSFENPSELFGHSYEHPSAHGSRQTEHSSFNQERQRQMYGRSVPSPMMGHRMTSYNPQSHFSPVSPQNPAIAALQLYGTSETSSHGSQAFPTHRHRSSSSSQWSQPFDGSPNVDTPLTSPMSLPLMQHHLGQMSEQAKSVPNRGKVALQKIPNSTTVAVSKDEQKRAKRRHAHNVVEQKRRDKINERIQELSHLVPAHRLEDTKIRKQLALNARTSAAAASGSSMSPPNANALRRSSSLSQPNGPDDRDMTKGNSLDSAVTWCRDLMWLLQRKLEQQSLLVEALENQGIPVPFEVPEEEARMASELMAAMDANKGSHFQYSRLHGSGLYVPNFTDPAGQRLPQDFRGNLQQTDFSNVYHASENPSYHNTDNQGWLLSPALAGRDSLDFIEEDKFEMEV